MTNPVDMAAMSRDVGDPATTTVADAFKKALGVDVNTLSIAEFSQMMAERADPSPLKKAKRMGEGLPSQEQVHQDRQLAANRGPWTWKAFSEGWVEENKLKGVAYEYVISDDLSSLARAS